MIKAILTDVDGVIVGNKHGVNFPLPNQTIINTLKKLHETGIPIILCTAKFNFAIRKIIEQATLNNPHITDGGALIINPLQNKILKKYPLEKAVLKTCLSACLEQDIYSELFTTEAYFIQQTQVSEFTSKRTHVLQTEPTVVDHLASMAEKEEVIKLIIFARNDNNIQIIEALKAHYENELTFIWSSHPYLKPVRPCVITAPNVSKQHAAKEVIKQLGISFDEVLGIGDTLSD